MFHRSCYAPIGIALSAVLLIGCPTAAPSDGESPAEAPTAAPPSAGSVSALEETSPADGAAANAVEGEVAPTTTQEQAPNTEPSAVEDAIPAPEPEPFPCGDMANRVEMARQIVDREPVGTEAPYPANGEPLHVFMDLNNADGPEKTITVRWSHRPTMHFFEQTITAGVSPTWRTWVRHRILPEQTGAWTVSIYAPGDCQIHSQQFQVQ